MFAFASFRRLAASAVTVALAAALPSAQAHAAPYGSFAGDSVPATLRAVTGETWFDPKDADNCKRQVALPWCVAEASKMRPSSAPGAGRAWTPDEEIALVEWAEKTARASWRTPDPSNNPEHWESFADAALAGKKWVGDCDNLTFTVLDLLSRQGFPMERMWRLQARASTKGILHMVGGVQLTDGRFVIVGDAMRNSYYPMPEGKAWIAANPVADGIIFHDFEGAAAFWAETEAAQQVAAR